MGLASQNSLGLFVGSFGRISLVDERAQKGGQGVSLERLLTGTGSAVCMYVDRRAVLHKRPL